MCNCDMDRNTSGHFEQKRIIINNIEVKKVWNIRAKSSQSCENRGWQKDMATIAG